MDLPAVPVAHINKLSWEELDLVLSFVPKNDDDPSLQFIFDAPTPSPSLLPLYATVCKTWNFHFEQRIFSSLKVKSTELEELSKIVKGHRATAISHLGYYIVLPTYSDHACTRFERNKDQNSNDEVFTDAIHGLFGILKRWEETVHQDGKRKASVRPTSSRCFELVIGDIYSPMDETYRGIEKYREDRLQWELGRRRDLWDSRWDHSFLQLRRAEDLPIISSITRFAWGHCTRNVAPGSMTTMASRFANIKHVVLNCSDNEKKYQDLKLRLRYDFSRSIETIPLHSLVSFNLEYNYDAPDNQNFIPATALHPSSPTTDCASAALHHLCQAPNLTTFALSGPIVISPSLFWPSKDNTITPHWPKLQNFSVTFSSCTPAGGWYFIRHPSKTVADDIFDSEDDARHARESELESDTDSDSIASNNSKTWDSYHPVREGRAQGRIPTRRFREWPDDAEILPLMEAMARAAKCMPSLKSISLMADLQAGQNAVFEVAFIAKGVEDFADEDTETDKLRARLYWQTGEWRPSKEVLDLWKEIVPGERAEDQGLMIKFLQY